MVKSSIADRYLKTLESNALDTRSPPESIRGKSPSKSPMKLESPVKSLDRSESAIKATTIKRGESPVKAPERSGIPIKSAMKPGTETIEFQNYKFAPKRSIDSPTKNVTIATPKETTPTAATTPKLQPVTSKQQPLSPPKLQPASTPKQQPVSPKLQPVSTPRQQPLSPTKSVSTPKQESIPLPKLQPVSTPKQESIPLPKLQPVSTPKQQPIPTPKLQPVSPLKTQATPSSPTRTTAATTARPTTSTTTTTASTTTTTLQSPLKSVSKEQPSSSLISSSKNASPIKLTQKPDRHLLMHNQDLTPSQVSWDSERKNWQAYEYLCHIVEAKEWMEKILGEELPPAEQFPESLQNGVALAKIVQKLKPELMKWPVFEHKRLQYRHTENITLFFDLLSALKIPQLFLFDMTDLYEKRNLPKVIYCIHAVSHFVAESNIAVSAVDDLVGKLEFSDDQLLTTEKGMQGRAMPNFGAMTRQLSGKHPKLEVSDDEDVEYDPVREKELEEAKVNMQKNKHTKAPEEEEEPEPEVEPEEEPEEEEVEVEVEEDVEVDVEEDIEEDLDDERLPTPPRRSTTRRTARRTTRETERRSSPRRKPVHHHHIDSESELDYDYMDSQYENDYDYSAGDVTLDDLTEVRARRRNLYHDEYSDSDSSSINISPPRRRDSIRSPRVREPRHRQNSYYYNERYSRHDPRQYRQTSYRNFSSIGSFRSKILSAAEIMLMELEALEPEIAVFQGICRGVLSRRNRNVNVKLQPEVTETIVKLQAIVRGKFYRRHSTVVQKVKLTESETSSLVRLQSLIRAQQPRKFVKYASGNGDSMVNFQCMARGVLARRKHNALLAKMRSPQCSNNILALQSGFRGVFLRFKLGCLYDELLETAAPTIKLQAVARGALTRVRSGPIFASWYQNVDKIILLQSFWRAKAQGSRYRTLISDKNPSLQTLKPFLHLYEENDSDYKSEVELEGLIREISKHMHENENLQARIDQLDMKIALLVKNNISIDELLLQQQKQNEVLRSQLLQEKHIDDEFGSFRPNVGEMKHSNGGALSGLKDQFDIKLLQKASKERFEYYQGLLYILQTQPIYISKLMNHTPPRSLDMAHLVLSVFGDAKTKREKFYLLKQLASSITQSTVGSAENMVAWRIVSYLNRSKESADVAREILEPATEKIKALSEQILEYDPHLIYENITGGGNMNAEEAIQDPAVRALFVQNLRWLRLAAAAVVQSLALNVDKLPYHIKFLAREVYREIMRCSDDVDEALSAVGQIVISQYLEPALLAADSLDLVDSAVGNTAKNLKLVGRVLHQVGVMQPFDTNGSTDIYLRPLNEFVKASAAQLTGGFQTAIVQCPDLQTHFNMSEFDDITMHDRPTLFITMDNLLALHYMCYNNITSIAPSNDNTLRPLVQQLGPLPKDSREMLDLARFKDVKLELNPKYCSSSLNMSISESSSLLATTKRCLVYVLRIQNSQPDLMSVLVNPVEMEDEVRYNVLLDTDNNRELAGELANLTFRELKLLTLEKVLELESSGAVSRENDYQALINAIANDIRNKDVVRQKKAANIASKRRNLRSLEEKGVYLKQRLESYSRHIDEALGMLLAEAHQQNMANSNSRRFQKFQIPIAGHGHAHSGENTPRFGMYKTTAEKLYEKGVLMRLHGYSDRQRRDVHFTFSCDTVVVFQIDVTYKGILLPNGHIDLSLDDLLAHQYQNEQTIGFLSGQLQFNTNRLMQLILDKFMTIHRYH